MLNSKSASSLGFHCCNHDIINPTSLQTRPAAHSTFQNPRASVGVLGVAFNAVQEYLPRFPGRYLLEIKRRRGGGRLREHHQNSTVLCSVRDQGMYTYRPVRKPLPRSAPSLNASSAPYFTRRTRHTPKASHPLLLRAARASPTAATAAAHDGWSSGGCNCNHVKPAASTIMSKGPLKRRWQI